MNKATILLIEDNDSLRGLYRDYLQEQGYMVKTASDGEEGLIKLQEGGNDITLLDMMMPKMNGIEVLKGLIEHPSRGRNGPIVLMTNMSDDAVIKEAASLGATSHMLKEEVTPDMVVENIEKLLK